MSLILKTLAGEPLKVVQSPKQRGEGLKGLVKGRRLAATVLGTDAQGGVQVRLMGATVLAESQVPLKPGQALTLTVEETEPGLVFSMADKPGESRQNRLNLALQEALQGRERLVRSINAVLQSEEPSSPQAAQAKETAARLKDAIWNESLNTRRAADPDGLARLVRHSGLNLEARLAQAVRQPGFEDQVLADPLPAHTLRGLAKALVRQLAAGLADTEDLDAMALKALRGLLSSAQGLSSALDAATRLNAELLPQKEMLYFPLPMLFGDQVLGGELLLQLPRHDEDGQRKGQAKLVFFLNMSALGPVTVEAMLNKERIKGSIVAADAPRAEFISELLPELTESLQQSGFASDFSVRAREAGEPRDASPLADLIRQSGHSFSITV